MIDIEIATNYRSARQTECSMGGGSKGSLLSWLLFIALIPFALAHLFARKLGEALR